MKIAFIAHVFPRLYNTFILNEITELINQGHTVHIFSINRSMDRAINEDVIKYDLLRNTHYFDEYLLSNHGDTIVSEKYSSYFRDNIRAFRPIAEKIKAEKFDFIHGILGNRPATAAMILSSLCGTPFSFETHAFDLFVDFPFSQEKFSTVSFISTISQYNKNFLVNALGAPQNKVHIVHIAPNKLMLDSIPAKPRMRNLVVSAARLHPIKGFSDALKTIAALKKDIPDIKYIIMGDGPLKQNLLEESQALGLGETVGFVSHITNEATCSVIRQAAVFLLPCVIGADGDRDGTPTAITEAMYLETPIVSSNLSGIPELVDDGENGFLVEPGNVKALTSAVHKLLLDDSLRTAMGHSGRRKIEQDFNIHTNVAKLVNLWKANM
ncbi:MAG: glycosyltransferase [Deltaproteobacteria bacterium]|nr:glycosyltransferase [Deltaproteobacteria bacterium]